MSALRRFFLRFYTLRALREQRANALMLKAWLLMQYVGDDEADMCDVNEWLDDVNREFSRRGLV